MDTATPAPTAVQTRYWEVKVGITAYYKDSCGTKRAEYASVATAGYPSEETMERVLRDKFALHNTYKDTYFLTVRRRRECCEAEYAAWVGNTDVTGAASAKESSSSSESS